MITNHLHSLRITNDLLSIQGSFEGEGVGIIDEDGNLSFPTVKIDKKKKKKRDREKSVESDAEIQENKKKQVKV